MSELETSEVAGASRNVGEDTLITIHQGKVIDNAKPGDTYFLELTCIEDKDFSDKDVVLFLSKIDGTVSMTERLFRVEQITMLN